MCLTSQQTTEKVLDPAARASRRLMLLFNGIDNQVHEAQRAGEAVAVQLGGPAGCLLHGTPQPAGQVLLAAAVEAQAAAGQEHAAPAAQGSEIVIDAFLDLRADLVKCPCNDRLDLLPGEGNALLPVRTGNLIGFTAGFDAVYKLALDILRGAE